LDGLDGAVRLDGDRLGEAGEVEEPRGHLEGGVDADRNVTPAECTKDIAAAGGSLPSIPIVATRSATAAGWLRTVRPGGISPWHGAHQLAKKEQIAALPLERLSAVPLTSRAAADELG